jgi:hypothetical protein
MIRIQNSGNSVHGTKITDVETGAEIKYVKRVELVLDADMNGPPEARLQLVKVDVDCVAEVKQALLVSGKAERKLEESTIALQAIAFMLFLSQKNMWVHDCSTDPPRKVFSGEKAKALCTEFARVIP